MILDNMIYLYENSENEKLEMDIFMKYPLTFIILTLLCCKNSRGFGMVYFLYCLYLTARRKYGIKSRTDQSQFIVYTTKVKDHEVKMPEQLFCIIFIICLRLHRSQQIN